MRLGLQGTRVLVVGGTRGIGRASAQALAGEGCRVAVGGRTGDRFISSAPGTPDGTNFGFCVDVTKRDWQACINDAVQQLDGLDKLVWSVSPQAPGVEDNIRADAAPFEQLLRLLVPRLEHSGKGAVVAVASQVGGLAVPANPGYAASKSALLSIVGSYARLLAAKRIRVNAVSPSEVEDPDGVWARMRRVDPARYERALARSPNGRLCTLGEVANAVVFLLSDAADFISGENIRIDAMARHHVAF